MIDLSKHTFTASKKGLVWLCSMTLIVVGLVVFMLYLVLHSNKSITAHDIGAFWELIVVIVFAPIFAYILYLDWRTYLYARDTTLEIDMLTMTFTYTHKQQSITFKSTDVWHWYWETGMFLSRVAANHSVIQLKNGKTLFLPCWLFEGNKFFLSDYARYNACYFISTNRANLFFPEAESAPNRYDFLEPRED